MSDDAMVGRILSRRDALGMAAHAGLGLALVGGFGRIVRAADTTQPATTPLVVSPALTEGPFFVDEKLNRSDLIGDTTRPSVINGLRLMLGFTVYKLEGKDYSPMKNAHVDVWHADTDGAYSDEGGGMNRYDTSGQRWLRGYQVTDAAGAATFKTIIPGWYNGRTPHIHFKVRTFSPAGQSTAEFTSQLFFHDEDLDKIYSQAPYNSRGKRESTNADDGIYSEREADGTTAGSLLTLELKKTADGKALTNHISIVVNDALLHVQRGGRGPGPGDRGFGNGRPPGPPPDGPDGFDGGPPPPPF